MEIVKRRSLSRARLERYLDELEAAADAGITVCVRPGHFSDCLASIEADCGDWAAEMRELPASVAESETGLVLFWSDDRKEVLQWRVAPDYSARDASRAASLREGGLGCQGRGEEWLLRR